MSQQTRKREHASPLLSVAAVARHCGVSNKTVYRWIDRGELPALKLGGLLRVDPSDLEFFLLVLH